jgi:hypothetical protein
MRKGEKTDYRRRRVPFVAVSQCSDPGRRKSLRVYARCTRRTQNQTPYRYASKKLTSKVVPTKNYLAGFALPIARLKGKWQLNQNRPEAKRFEVSNGLPSDGGT